MHMLAQLQATLSHYVTLFAGYASVWLHKLRVAKGLEDAPEHGYQLDGELLRIGFSMAPI